MKILMIFISMLLPVFAVGLFISQILFTNNLAQDGSTLKNITEHIDKVSLENERLEEEIASASSILAVQKKAEEGGFVEAKHFLTLVDGQYLVALNQKR